MLFLLVYTSHLHLTGVALDGLELATLLLLPLKHLGHHGRLTQRWDWPFIYVYALRSEYGPSFI